MLAELIDVDYEALPAITTADSSPRFRRATAR